MKVRSFGEKLAGALLNLCPECFEGKVFSGIFAMHQKCSRCGRRYEKDDGYFSGAIWLGYYLQLFLILPAFLLLLLNDVSLLYVVGIPIAILAALFPLSFRLPRLLCLHFDTHTGRDGEHH